jgi:DNA-binding NtrC family response regulator
VKKPKKILVVDDDEISRTGLSRILSKDGYLVDSVSNGFEALSYLRQQEVDLIMTDINMPEMNGIDFLKEITTSFPNKNVIMITGYGKVETYIASMNHGAVEYLNKPIVYTELKTILRKLFQELI